MAKGLAVMVGYNYNQEYHTQYYDAVAAYNNSYTMYDRGQARHNFTAAGTWELPFGRGGAYFGNVNRFVDAFIGGWATSHILMAHSGDLLNFQQATVTGDPRQNVPAGYYFNPAVFSVAPAYTARTNPLYYSGLRGPSFWQLDSTAVKYFQITERIKFELRLEMFNSPNVFMPSDPDITIGSGTMGRSTWVAKWQLRPRDSIHCPHPLLTGRHNKFNGKNPWLVRHPLQAMGSPASTNPIRR